MQLDQLREKALANIWLLLEVWQIDFIKVNDDEIDFISKTRHDEHFGACRFNLRKGLGSDFAGTTYTNEDYQSIGMGFSKEDFSSNAGSRGPSMGFDVVGFAQRIYGSSTYRDAARELDSQLRTLSTTHKLETIDNAAAIKRQWELDKSRAQKLKIAKKIWNICQPINGTIGETYLHSRKIFLSSNQPNIRFHSKVQNSELKQMVPALLFRVSKSYGGDLVAIHRIFLADDGTGKAKVNNPKLALGDIKGAGIWLGTPGEELCICEGPENALSILSLGYSFVVSTINGTNYHNLTIPDTVRCVKLFPDGDSAGVASVRRAQESYKNKEIKVVFPDKKENKPKWDWNDMLIEAANNVK